jgi:hypothetical protein
MTDTIVGIAPRHRRRFRPTWSGFPGNIVVAGVAARRVRFLRAGGLTSNNRPEICQQR